MAALGLLAFLLRFATEEERAAIAEDVSPVPFLILGTREPPPDSEQARLEVRALRAARARTAILARLLATAPLPRATALDPATKHRADFDLGWLRDNEHFVDWPAGTLNIPPRGHLPAIYSVAIEVEVEAVAGEAVRRRRATDADLDVCFAELDRARPSGSPPLTRADIRKSALPWLDAHGMTAKKQDIEARFQSAMHRHRRGRPGRR